MATETKKEGITNEVRNMMEIYETIRKEAYDRAYADAQARYDAAVTLQIGRLNSISVEFIAHQHSVQPESFNDSIDVMYKINGIQQKVRYDCDDMLTQCTNQTDVDAKKVASFLIDKLSKSVAEFIVEHVFEDAKTPTITHSKLPLHRMRVNK